MSLRAIALDFNRAGGYAMPQDRELHRMAIEFAKKDMAEIPDYSSFAKVWVVTECGPDDKPVEIHGALGFTMRPDFTLVRFKSKQALITGYSRANAYLADNGCRGSESLVFVDSKEGPEQRCPQWEESLAALNAKAADRWLIKIR
jgi:hypothetical protein